jgi:hypothetical protein
MSEDDNGENNSDESFAIKLGEITTKSKAPESKFSTLREMKTVIREEVDSINTESTK